MKIAGLFPPFNKIEHLFNKMRFFGNIKMISTTFNVQFSQTLFLKGPSQEKFFEKFQNIKI